MGGGGGGVLTSKQGITRPLQGEENLIPDTTRSKYLWLVGHQYDGD